MFSSRGVWDWAGVLLDWCLNSPMIRAFQVSKNHSIQDIQGWQVVLASIFPSSIKYHPPQKKKSLVHIISHKLKWFHFVNLRRWTFWEIPNKNPQKCPNKNVQHLEFSQLSENLQDFHPAIPFLHPPCYEELVKVDVPLSRSWPKMSAPRPVSVSVGCWLGWSYFSGFWGASLKEGQPK